MRSLPCSCGWQIEISRAGFYWTERPSRGSTWSQLTGTVRRWKPHVTLIIFPSGAELLLSRKQQKTSVWPPNPRVPHTLAARWLCRAGCCFVQHSWMGRTRDAAARGSSHTEPEGVWAAGFSPCRGGICMAHSVLYCSWPVSECPETSRLAI